MTIFTKKFWTEKDPKFAAKQNQFRSQTTSLTNEQLIMQGLAKSLYNTWLPDYQATALADELWKRANK